MFAHSVPAGEKLIDPSSAAGQLRRTAARDADDAVVLRTPINVRSTSMAILAILGIGAFLYAARSVFVPITIALLASYALTPVVSWLKRRLMLPKAVGAALVLGAIGAAAWLGLQALQPQAIRILDMVPQATAKFRQAMRPTVAGPPSAVDKIKDAAVEIANAANAVAATAPTATAAPRTATVTPSVPPINFTDYMLTGTASLAAAAGELIVVVALVYFLLVTGDNFRRSLMRMSRDTLSEKKITIQILDQIESQIQRYLIVQLLASVLLAAVLWIIFYAAGVENASAWACIGGALHLVPYAGPTAFGFSIALVAYVQFDTLQPVVIVVGSTLTAIGVVGFLLIPWLTERVASLNAVTVFVTVLFWGWLWGIWGLLLGVPIVMAINAVCARIEDLRPISEFLSYVPRKSAGASH